MILGRSVQLAQSLRAAFGSTIAFVAIMAAFVAYLLIGCSTSPSRVVDRDTYLRAYHLPRAWYRYAADVGVRGDYREMQFWTLSKYGSTVEKVAVFRVPVRDLRTDDMLRPQSPIIRQPSTGDDTAVARAWREMDVPEPD